LLREVGLKQKKSGNKTKFYQISSKRVAPKTQVKKLLSEAGLRKVNKGNKTKFYEI
jgi:hypothetical protein